MNNSKRRKDVILCDFKTPNPWHFKEGLDSATKHNWEKIECVNNSRKGKLSNIKRYTKYFTFSFRIFFHRRKFDNIIAWQQFYGLLFAFFCRLFHTRKKNNLFVMVFIYIPKKGLFGKLYYHFMHYTLSSKYIDKIFLFSSSEIKRYLSEFELKENKFIFMPLGDDIIESKAVVDFAPGFIFASGYSNRDFQFLMSVLCHKKYTVRIYGSENFSSDNIIMKDEVVGNKLSSVLHKARIVALPLKENRESGQLTLIHAMQAGIPVIATNTDCMKDYIINGINGFVVPNIKELWLEKIQLLYSDDELYSRMSKNCKDLYMQKFTAMALGKNVGESIINSLREQSK
jgi:glycosyltransferase involved in cell wall biosynthesis